MKNLPTGKHKASERIKLVCLTVVVFLLGWSSSSLWKTTITDQPSRVNFIKNYSSRVVDLQGEEDHQRHLKIDISNITGANIVPSYGAYIVSEGPEPNYDTVLAVQSKAVHVTHKNCNGCLTTSEKLNYSSFGTYMREAWQLIYDDARSRRTEYVVKIDDDTIVPESWLNAVIDDMYQRGIKYAGDAGFWADRPVIMFGKMYIIEIETLRETLECLKSGHGPEPEDQKTGWCLRHLDPMKKATYLMDGTRIGHKDFRNKWMVVCIRCDTTNSHALQSYVKNYPNLNQGEKVNGATNQGLGWS